MADNRKVVSGLSLVLNGFKFAIVANSMTVKDGFSSKTAMAADNGEIYYTEDLSSAIGYIKVEVPSTEVNIKNARTIRNDSFVEAKIFNKDGTYTRTMKNGVLSNATEDSFGTDGKLTFEINGDILV